MSPPDTGMNILYDTWNPHSSSATLRRPLRKAQLLIKRVRLGFPAEEVNQCLHLILAAALLEHRVSISSSFLGVHRVLLEDAVEHVGAVDLGGEVAVIA